MKTPQPSICFAAMLAVALLLPAFAASHPKKTPVEPRIVSITAKRFAFSPDLITLKKGETVKLRLTSEDVTHGFFMRALKIDEDIDPAKPTEIILTPQVAGTFTTICDHFCGANHGAMKMTIVVE